jgi:hypothetical protein
MEGLMFGRRYKSNQRNTFAAGAAVFVLAGICTAPALAATSTQIDCPDEATRATLDVPAHFLATDFVSHSVPAASITDENISAEIDAAEIAPTSSLLAPRAAAAIRNAFISSHTPPMVGTDAKAVSEPEDDESTLPESGMNTELPGVSDEELARYKKQMYRRDI